ncbi:MAG: response regulator [Acidobacteriota bacterium]
MKACLEPIGRLEGRQEANRHQAAADSGSGIIGAVYATLSDPVLDSILIVDDDEGVTETFAQMLRLQGYVVHTALTAETGLLEAAESQPGAIILDLCMPTLDGLGFLRRLREAETSRATPVAIVTADYFLDDEISAELHALGAELRFKPLWLEDLVDLARNLLKVTH